MIELTEEQRNSIREGLPVRVAEDGDQYVLLRADVYERLADAVYDDSPWTAEEIDQLRADSLAARGANGGRWGLRRQAGRHTCRVPASDGR